MDEDRAQPAQLDQASQPAPARQSQPDEAHDDENKTARAQDSNVAREQKPAARQPRQDNTILAQGPLAIFFFLRFLMVSLGFLALLDPCILSCCMLSQSFEHLVSDLPDLQAVA